MPKISIIVSIYNVEKYLAKCLDSLINQTFSDIEIICVDDGSTDGSFSILSSYAALDKRIIAYKNTNNGVSVTRNKGLELATSPYIMSCDSDDYYEPNMCELMFKAIDENDVDMAMCSYNEVYDNGYIKLISCNYSGIYEDNCNDKIKFTPSLWSKIFKKSIIDKYNLKFPDGLWYEDLAFIYMYMAVAKKYYYLDKNLYSYIQRDDSIIGTTKKGVVKVLDHIKIMECIYDFYMKNDLFYKNKNRYLKILTYYLAATFENLPNENHKLFFTEAQKLLGKIDYKSLKDLDKKTIRIIEYIKQNKDPSFLVDRIKLFNVEIFRTEETHTRKRFYLFNIKIFSIKSHSY